ncbi:MAG: hypothetical protein V2B20_13745 [Pseudomonadota bacterium]
MPYNPGRLLHQEYWHGHAVEVRDHGNHRSLYFGSDLHSRMSLSHPQDLVLSYTWYMVETLLFVPEPQDILIVGIGAGSFVRFFSHHFPGCHIDAVDISSHIINVARGYFCLPENDRIVVHCRDGLEFLKEPRDKRYDLILIDAFDALGMAPAIYSEPFLSRCSASLKDAGVVSCNLWSDDAFRLKEIKTILADHFPGCLYLPVPNRGNIVALAMKKAIPWSQILLKNKEFTRFADRYGIDFKGISNVAKANNLSLSRKFLSFLQPIGSKN